MKFIKNLKLAAVVMATSGAALSASAQDLRGAGSSFVNPLFQKIFSEYKSSKVDYQSIGSGAGISQVTAKTVDFGDSDAPLNDEQTAKLPAPALHNCYTGKSLTAAIAGSRQGVTAVSKCLFLYSHC